MPSEKKPDPKPEKKITVDVVVGGVGAKVTVNTNQTVERLVAEALKAADQKGEKPQDWVLRDENGNEIVQGQRISDVAAIKDGVTLFLSQTTAGGG